MVKELLEVRVMEEVKTEDRRWCVYCHTNITNDKKYIGQTKAWPRERRWQNGYGYKTQPYFWRAIEKYGWDNFSSEILKDDLTKEEADKVEIEFIALYDTTNPNKGYNLAAGGGGPMGVPCPEELKKKYSEMFTGEGNPFYGKHHTDETRKVLSEQHTGMKASDDARAKMSQSQTERFKDPVERAKCGWEHTEEQKKAHSEHMSGEGHPMFGKHHSEETKKKISEARQNLSDEARKNLSIAAKARCTDEWVERMREMNTGKHLTEEHKRKISESNKGKKVSEDTIRKRLTTIGVTKIIQYNRCGEFMQLWDSAKQVEDVLHISSSKVYACCNKRRNHAGGFVWRKEHEPLTSDEILELKAKNDNYYPGVTFNKRMNKWQAYIITKGKRKNLGSYANRDDAIAARMTAEVDKNNLKEDGDAI